MKRTLRMGIAALLLLLSPLSAVRAELQWQWLGQLPANQTLFDVISAGGQFVAVGEGGTALTSPDGRIWAWHFTGVATRLQSVAYAGGQYVAVGGSAGAGAHGVILTSPDGVAWTLQADLPAVELNAVAAGGGRFVIAGTVRTPDGFRTVFFSSADGQAWRRSGTDIADPVASLTYGNGMFAAMHGQDVVVSADGLDWTVRPLPAHTSGQALVFTGAEFVVPGIDWSEAPTQPVLLRSPDTERWTVSAAGDQPSLRGLSYTAGRYVVAGADGAVLTSADGAVWETHAAGRMNLNAIACEAEICVAVGEGGDIAASTNLVSWTELNREPGVVAGTVAYGNGEFLAGSWGKGFSTTDGVTWQPFDPQAVLMGLYFQNGHWLAGGNTGNGRWIILSEDGRHWRFGPDLGVSTGVEDIAYGKGRYVVGIYNLGPGVLSADLQTLTVTQLPPGGAGGPLMGIAYGKGLFVGVSGDRILYSSDGLQWVNTGVSPGPTRQPEDTTYFFRDVAYGNGHFVAVGGDTTGFVYVSADGRNWTRAAESPMSGLLGVIDGGGQFLAWGRGEIMTSADGQTWSHAPNRAGAAQFVYGAGRFIAVGGAGRTLMTAAGCGTMFPDVPADHAACDAVEQLARRGVTAGYPDGSFQPEGPITRAELAKLLVRSLGLSPAPQGALPFSDTAGHWAAEEGYLQAGVAAGLFNGFPDGSFRPEAPVTRAQLTKLVAAAAGLQPATGPSYSDIAGVDWYAGWVAAARQADLVGPGGYHPLWSGDRFLGDRPATRGETAILLDNLSNY